MTMNCVNLSYYQFRYLSDICRYIRYLSDICRYLSDIGHIGNLGSFTKAILLQKCSISLISPDIAIRSRSSRSDWLHQMGGQIYGRTNMKNLRPPTQKAASRQWTKYGCSSFKKQLFCLRLLWCSIIDLNLSYLMIKFICDCKRVYISLFRKRW